MNTISSNAGVPGTDRSHELATTPLSAEMPHWEHTLRNGTAVTIRPLRKDDAELERRFIDSLSAQSRRFRFLGQISCASPELVRRLTDIDYVHDVAFVAVATIDGERREIGVARYSVAEDGRSCECAVTVGDDFHGQGLGTLLMTHLIDVARGRGIGDMFSIDSAENSAMRELALSLGFRREPDPDDASQVIHRLSL
jgi:GNAT superfamily N-acetyltransferase